MPAGESGTLHAVVSGTKPLLPRVWNLDAFCVFR